MMKWFVLCAALFAAWPLHAGSGDIHKCVRDDGGATAYRSRPCGAGESLVAMVEPAPEVQEPVRTSRPATTARRASTGSPFRSRPFRSSRTSHRLAAGPAVRGHRPRRQRRNPCRSAKQARDDFQRRRGIHITMDELSRWNHRVYDACK